MISHGQHPGDTSPRTLSKEFPAHLFRMRALARSAMTCNLCASSRIARSFEVMGFLPNQYQYSQGISRDKCNLLAQGQRYAFSLCLLTLPS